METTPANPAASFRDMGRLSKDIPSFPNETAERHSLNRTRRFGKLWELLVVRGPPTRDDEQHLRRTVARREDGVAGAAVEIDGVGRGQRQRRVELAVQHHPAG